MSVFLTAALAVATQFQPTCSWDRPGANPYTGSSSAAIERYTDIPEQVRNTLKRRLEERQYDDQVTITRDAIVGKSQYQAGIRDMHFGAASVCASVTRSKWAENRQEPGAVYCVGDYCILVPRICGNISRITRLPAPAVARAPAPPAAPAAPALAERNLARPLDGFDPGLGDAAPTDTPLTPEEQQQARDRAGGNVADAMEAIQQAEAANVAIAAVDDHDHNGEFGRHPNWPTDHHDHDDSVNPASPVPEADTWLMLLAGLGVLGLFRRRR